MDGCSLNGDSPRARHPRYRPRVRARRERVRVGDDDHGCAIRANEHGAGARARACDRSVLGRQFAARFRTAHGIGANAPAVGRAVGGGTMKRKRVTKALKARARELAAQPYHIVYVQDKATGDATDAVMVTCIEMPFCLGQGATKALALADFYSALYDYILSGLLYNNPIPEPYAESIATASTAQTIISPLAPLLRQLQDVYLKQIRRKA